jgi:hypothetical protein
MKSTAKSQAQMRVLKERIDQRIHGSATINTSRAANDANGWPMLFLSVGGTETASAPVIAIRISAQDAVSKDVFGNALTAFAPHTIELAYEQAIGAAVPAAADLILAMVEIAKIGMKLKVEEIAAGTAVTEASMNAAHAADFSFESEVVWPSHAM